MSQSRITKDFAFQLLVLYSLPFVFGKTTSNFTKSKAMPSEMANTRETHFNYLIAPSVNLQMGSPVCLTVNIKPDLYFVGNVSIYTHVYTVELLMTKNL